MIRLLLITCMTSVLRASYSTTVTTAATTAMNLRAMDFEVFGRVQGVFFRKYTKQEADKLGLRGWCMNTSKGTVLGHMQGPNEKVENITDCHLTFQPEGKTSPVLRMQWLKTKGSPSSQIDKAEFRNMKDINEFTFESFDIRKD